MKKMVVIVFVLLMSMSVTVFSSEKVSDTDTMMVQQVHIEDDITTMPDLLIEMSFESENQEVIAFGDYMSLISVSDDTLSENVHRIYFDNYSRMNYAEGFGAILSDEHILNLLCFHFFSRDGNITFNDNKNTTFNNEREDKPILWRA